MELLLQQKTMRYYSSRALRRTVKEKCQKQTLNDAIGEMHGGVSDYIMIRRVDSLFIVLSDKPVIVKHSCRLLMIFV